MCSPVPATAAGATGLAPPSLEEVAAGGVALMRSVAKVITTTTNKVVVSANSAVNIGRWSNLAIIALSPFLLRKAGNSTVPSVIINLRCASHRRHLLRRGGLLEIPARYVTIATPRSSGLTPILARATNRGPLDPRPSGHRS